VVPPPTVDAASDRLPDLRAALIRDLRIVPSGSRRLLRFTGIMWNQGAGPFEIRASRRTTKSKWDVDQILYDTAGGSRRVQTDATMRYAGDGHDHWHVRRMLSYHLWGSTGTFRDAKVGFCFFDTTLIDGDLPRSPSGPKYTESMCGRRASLKTRNGISVGWGDKYRWDFAYQWIDITGLPGGTYTIRSAVDMYGSFLESSDTNNCAWSRIRFKSTGRTVTVLDRGTACVNDYSATPYADDVRWAIAAGVSTGCDADLFCTNAAMNRGQVAMFLARAMRLPATTTDHFDDDDGSVYEPYIDRVAEAGIMRGCRTGDFCPTARQTRSQAAGALAKAVAAPPTTEDFFDDDDGSGFESSIDRLAALGIAVGCGTRRFCPSRDITRGQFAGMLRRAFEAS
jgi:hypothetical protein